MRPTRPCLSWPALLAALLASGCGGSTAPAPPPVDPPAQAETVTFPDLPQRIGLPFGDENAWDLRRDLALASGGAGQVTGGLQLSIGVPTSPVSLDSLLLDAALVPFGLVLDYADLAFFTPGTTLAAAELGGTALAAGFTGNAAALRGSAVAPAGGGALGGTVLQQPIDLTGVAPGSAMTLQWRHRVAALDGAMSAPAPAAFRVTLLDDATGAPVQGAFFDAAATATPSLLGPFTVSAAAAGKRVTLRFELVSSPLGFALVDDVSLLAGGSERVQNPDFQAPALAPWIVQAVALPSQVASAVPELLGVLSVTRRVYAPAHARWARWVDTFTNTGAAPVATEAVYLTELGANQDALVSAVPGAGGRALSAWDSAVLPRRDVALVFGSTAQAPLFQSASTLGGGEGKPYLWVRHPLALKPGESRVVVQFLVLTEEATGTAAAGPAARPQRADQEAAAIAAGFWTGADYRQGMTAGELAALVNW